MKTEMNERVIALLNQLLNDRGRLTLDEVLEMEKVKEKLTEECQKEYAKLNGKTDVLKVAKTILKSAGKKHRTVLTKVAVQDGYTYLTDSYEALRIQDDTGLFSAEQYVNEDKDGQYPTMKNVFKEPNSNEKVYTLPPLAEIETLIKSQKANNKLNNNSLGTALVKFGDVYVKAEHLKNGILATGSNTIRTYGRLKPFFLENDNVTYLGLSVNRNPEDWNENSVWKDDLVLEVE